MATLETGDKQYTTLLNEIETGQIKIPQKSQEKMEEYEEFLEEEVE